MNQTDVPEFTRADFENLAHYLRLMHHIPGRMRLRVKKGIQDQFSHLPEMTLEDLKRLLKRIPAIEDVRVNKIVGAVIIQYNPDTVPPSDWEHYLASGDASAVLTDLDLESGAIR